MRCFGKLVHAVIMVTLRTAFILWPFLSYEDVKTCSYINFKKKNAIDFTSNNLFEMCENEETKECTIVLLRTQKNSGLSYTSK